MGTLTRSSRAMAERLGQDESLLSVPLCCARPRLRRPRIVVLSREHPFDFPWQLCRVLVMTMRAPPRLSYPWCLRRPRRESHCHRAPAPRAVERKGDGLGHRGIVPPRPTIFDGSAITWPREPNGTRADSERECASGRSGTHSGRCDLRREVVPRWSPNASFVPRAARSCALRISGAEHARRPARPRQESLNSISSLKRRRNQQRRRGHALSRHPRKLSRTRVLSRWRFHPLPGRQRRDSGSS